MVKVSDLSLIVFDSLGYEDEMLTKKRLSRRGSMTGKKSLRINGKQTDQTEWSTGQ